MKGLQDVPMLLYGLRNQLVALALPPAFDLEDPPEDAGAATALSMSLVLGQPGSLREIWDLHVRLSPSHLLSNPLVLLTERRPVGWPL